MDTYSMLQGFLIYLMIGLATCRPQYNYQSNSASQSIALPFNVGSSAHNTQIMQIVSSQPVSHTYLPPAQQALPASQALFSPAAPTSQYLPPTQSFSPSLNSGQQVFKDVSQIPLQNSHSQGFLGQSNSYQGFSGEPSSFSGQFQGSSGGFNGQSPGFSSQSSSFNQQAAFQPQQRTIVTKDIFVHTAPPDAEEEQDFSKQLQSIPIRKNYRIIFIKAPTQNLKIAAEALKQAQTINEEKTVIYVLSKKTDVADLQRQISQIQSPQTINQKPEVYFIKYKTNEEAQRAQQEIQAQYDKLGGSTSISDEGIAPVVGAVDTGKISGSGSVQSGSINSPNRKYLPAKI